MTDPTSTPPTPGLINLQIQGIYFDGSSSRDRQATLLIRGDTAHLQVAADGDKSPEQASWPITALRIDPPMSRVRRVVKLPGGGRFETQDDASVSALERHGGQNRLLGGVRRLESSWSLTLGTLAALGVFVWGFLTFGLPALARTAAAATPRNVLKSFDVQAVKLLDDGCFMGPSQLSRARQAELQSKFKQVGAWAGGGYPYRLLLRDGEPEQVDCTTGFNIGANAFALPNGTIVMTDQLVELAESDRDLLGVLAHEAGHVTRRHSLSGVYQALGLTVLVSSVTGDLISASTFAAAIPTALLKNGYSRQAETESDEVAGRYLMETYGTTKPLRDLLQKLSQEAGDADGTSAWEEFLRTHPGTPQRIAHLKTIEESGQP